MSLELQRRTEGNFLATNQNTHDDEKDLESLLQESIKVDLKNPLTFSVVAMEEKKVEKSKISRKAIPGH